MVRKSSLFTQALVALPLAGAGLFSAFSSTPSYAQATARITSQVEGSALVSLPNQVHPWARPQFDRGLAPAGLSGRMLLVLQRSPEQESALQSLLASQQDPHSANYHKWLTPQQFGQRFGIADSDLQTVTSYLASQGISVGRVYKNHMAIEVGATAGQVRSTFQTEIHAYSVAGKTFYANNSAPKLPAALHGVVSGFASLNNFHVAGGTGAGQQGTFDPGTHTLKPLYTLRNGGPYGISPGDLSVIYNVPAATGQGLGGQNVNVGVIGDSDINVAYVNNYRSIFGLPANTPTVVVDGNDPGLNDDAYIAYKQIELIGAVAPNANIYYYTSATTDYDTGLDFALIRAVEDNQVQVLVNGFQACESSLGVGMGMINSMMEQAAAQGMTVVAAAGNTGSAACEVPGTAGQASSGYAVNGYASSPYVTAVGGTDFFYNNPATYWSNTNTGYTSAIKRAPEQVWNDSYDDGSNSNFGTNVELAGGGGVSSVGLDGSSTPQPMPSYQLSNAQAAAIGGSKARVLPDISFFAGTGANNSMGYNNTAYMFCMKYTDCTGSSGSTFSYSGGTEASSAVFAGAVALAVEQYNSGTRFGLGNVNPSIYAEFNSKTAPAMLGNDVTLGRNELQCSGGPNCSGGLMTGYRAATGYDAASGLGSLNITSFVANYAPRGTAPSSVTLTVTDSATGLPPVCGATPNCTTHSHALQFAVSVTGTNPTGDVALFTSSPLAADQAIEALTLPSGTANTKTATDPSYDTLPGGTYKIYARYAGDAANAASVTAVPYSITVRPESCFMVIYGHNINTTPTNIAYGSPISITAEPYSTGNPSYVGIPSGSLQVFDNGAQITSLPLNSQGAATFSSNLLSYGSHSIVLSYPGDASYGSCSTSAFVANVTKAATTTTLNSPETDVGSSNVGVGNSSTLGITAVVQSATTPSNGTAPTGSVTFSTATPRTVPLISGFDPNGNAIATASTVIGQNDIPTGGNISATYNPGSDPNYLSSTSKPVGFTASQARSNSATTTTFTITDNYGTYPSSGTYPNSSTPSFPALDSITLNMHVRANNPNQTVFLVYANGVLLTPATWSGGFLTGGGVPIDINGNATFTIPQQNGYLGLPSGQVQFTVLYDGWIYTDGSAQSDPSSANQIVTIVDDRTSADFSLQSDTTVNQQNPLVSPTTQATYNLRLTSIYNFQSAYSTQPINLSCKVTGYTNPSGVRSTPAGLACGFTSALSSTTTSVTFQGNSTTPGFISQTLYVGAAGGYSVSTNTTPLQPSTRWWLATGGTTLACIFLMGLPARRRKWQSLLGACVIMIVGFGMTGCGATVTNGPQKSYYDNLNNGGSSGSNGSGGTAVPAGVYTVLVTASTTTNTSLVHTLPVQVVVGSGF